MKITSTILASVGFASLLALSSMTSADSEDIYPEVFIQDCKYASVDSDFSARVLEFVGTDVDKEKAGEEFSSMCSCLSNAFFKRDFKDPAYAYEVYINMIQFKGYIVAPQRYKSSASRDINACEIQADKTRVKEGIKRFDKEHASEKKSELQKTFMADIRKSLGSDVNEGYLRKADYLSKCYADRVNELTNSSNRDHVVYRTRQNLRAGTFINVPVTNANREVEMIVLNIEDRCW